MITKKMKERKELIEKVQHLSPFELKDQLIKLAKDSEKKGICTMLNAGRGNPNWTAASAREVFFTLGDFAVKETKRTWDIKDLAGMPEKKGIYYRFKSYIESNKESKEINLLKEIIDYGIEVYKFDSDEWVYELVDGIIGDHYPMPDRMLRYIERVVHDYLIKEMGGNICSETTHDIFAVEGGTAAMCYIFESLISNHLIEKEDTIAIMVPIFTPYLEMANLPRYNFNVIEIYASEMNEQGRHTWQYPKEELDKLKNSDIKVLCVVNPSNPASVAMEEKSIEYLKNIVKEHNPNLLIITDDVYGTFVDNFKSIMVAIPYNTLGVYSYSKYFGATGWRLGVIALSHDNVYDKLIREIPKEYTEELNERYSSLTTEPEKIKFIDRLVADSRQVALNHTAGLSTPQQVQMAIFSLFALLDKEDTYKRQTKDICFRRKKLLYENLGGFPMSEDKLSTSYYNEIDLLVWAKLKYGEEFVDYLKENCNPLEFLFQLAEKYGIVLLNGNGFQGPQWSIRVSLANLKDDDYVNIGKAINTEFAEYAKEWKAFKW